MQTLRQKAPRALMVLERHKGDATLALFEQTLLPATTAFMASYDATHAYQIGRATRALAQTKAVAHVTQRLGVWLAFLERDVPGFDASEYAASSTSAVNVIAAGERLLALVNDLGTQQLSLPYAEQLTTDLTETLRVAQECWVEARGGLNELQARQAETRDLALAFERELDAFRKALKAILGKSDTDYLSLVVPRRGKVTDQEAVVQSQPQAQPEPRVPAQSQAPVVLNGANSFASTSPH